MNKERFLNIVETIVAFVIPLDILLRLVVFHAWRGFDDIFVYCILTLLLISHIRHGESLFFNVIPQWFACTIRHLRCQYRGFIKSSSK